MDWPNFAKRLLLADQRIGEQETAIIKRAMLQDGVVDRDEVEFLVALKREAVNVHPEFDAFLLSLVKKVVLADGVIADAEALWLRRAFFADNQLTLAEVKFIEDLRRAAKKVGPEFDRLHRDCTRLDDSVFLG